MNLPNALTVSRLVAIPVLLAVMLMPFPNHDLVAAAIFTIFSITDTVDGQIARRYGLVTDLGKFLDPLADKLFVLAVLVGLVQEGLIPAWVVLVIFGRELLITILRSVAVGQGRIISASSLGKAKTVTQVGAILLLILGRPYPALEPFAIGALAIALLVTVYSGLDYLWKFRHVLFGNAPRQVVVLPVGGGGPTASDVVHPLARELGERLIGAGLTISLAESCTGGLLAKLITDLPGCSAYFVGGVVAYTNLVKAHQLGVPADVLAAHGAVSAEVALAMAEGARAALGSDLALSVTGISGPDADGTSKPVGLTYIGIAGPGLGRVIEQRWEGDRWDNRRSSAEAALQLAIDSIPQITLDRRTGVR